MAPWPSCLHLRLSLRSLPGPPLKQLSTKMDWAANFLKVSEDNVPGLLAVGTASSQGSWDEIGINHHYCLTKNTLRLFVSIVSFRVLKASKLLRYSYRQGNASSPTSPTRGIQNHCRVNSMCIAHSSGALSLRWDVRRIQMAILEKQKLHEETKAGKLHTRGIIASQ